MPLPKPKLLPQVKYQPGGDTGAGDKGSYGAKDSQSPYTGHYGPAIDQYGYPTGSETGDVSTPGGIYGIDNPFAPLQENTPAWSPAAIGNTNTVPPLSQPTFTGIVPSYNDPRFTSGGSFGRPPLPNNEPGGANPNEPGPMANQYAPLGAPGTGNVAGPPSPTAADWQGTLDKNRNLYNQAAAGGDSAAMARLDAEWKRIAPLAQQYGISAQRLVNSYMQPSNPAAKSDFNSALAAAISDDVWAKEATNAFGRPPNQLEWDEHWKAMNVGGRDPLEGHAQAVQNIQAAMQNIGQANQNQSYDEYSKWLAGQ